MIKTFKDATSIKSPKGDLGGLLFFLLLFAVFAISTTAAAQDYCMTAPIGYGRATTGGGDGKIVLVKTHTELRNALRTSGAAVIIVTENITFGSGQQISETISNKTLLGLPGVKLISTARVKNGGILSLKDGSSNVIIRNLIFEGPGAYDVDGNDLLTNNGCNNLWVDHCEFYDGVDGNFDNVNGADNITISWCKFGYKIAPLAGGSGGSNDHRFSNLIGGSASAAPSDGQYSITFQYCRWSDGCKERMPRARNAQLHILNCYYNTNVSGSLALGLEGGSKGGTTCYVEGCDFKKVSRVYQRYGDTSQPLTVKYIDCIKAGSTNIGASNIGEAPKPTYAYTAIAATAVETAVTSAQGAGATLNVTTDGNISIGTSSGAFAPSLEADWTVSETGNELTVQGVELAEMRLFDLSGKMAASANNSQKINTGILKNGYYILSIRAIDGGKASRRLMINR